MRSPVVPGWFLFNKPYGILAILRLAVVVAVVAISGPVMGAGIAVTTIVSANTTQTAIDADTIQLKSPASNDVVITIHADSPDQPFPHSELEYQGPFYDWTWTVAPGGPIFTPATGPSHSSQDQSLTLNHQAPTATGTFVATINATGYYEQRAQGSTDEWTKFQQHPVSLTINYVLLNGCVSIVECRADTGVTPKVTDSIENVNWVKHSHSHGYEATLFYPMKHRWTVQVGTDIVVAPDVSINTEPDQDDIEPGVAGPVPVGLANYYTAYFKVDAWDSYGTPQDSDNWTTNFWRQNRVVPTGETRTAPGATAFTAWVPLGGTLGTPGQNPQNVTFSAGTAQTVTIGVTFSAGLTIGYDPVKVAFGLADNLQVSSGVNYANGTSININGDTEAAESWRQQSNTQAKGNVFSRNVEGVESAAGYVWVDQPVWFGTMTKMSKTVYATGIFPLPTP